MVCFFAYSAVVHCAHCLYLWYLRYHSASPHPSSAYEPMPRVVANLRRMRLRVQDGLPPSNTGMERGRVAACPGQSPAAAGPSESHPQSPRPLGGGSRRGPSDSCAARQALHGKQPRRFGPPDVPHRQRLCFGPSAPCRQPRLLRVGSLFRGRALRRLHP